MRIIAGDWRGRKLAEPRGKETTRPTTDRVREACASMVEAAREEGICGARVLDAFAGSGAMGMEMLSRGAAHATFCDSDRGATQLVRKNLAALSCAPARFDVLGTDSYQLGARGPVPGAPFDVVILDPPYADAGEDVAAMVSRLQRFGLLAPEALVLYEHASRDDSPRIDGFELYRHKRYGITAVDLFAARSTQQPQAGSEDPCA